MIWGGGWHVFSSEGDVVRCGLLDFYRYQGFSGLVVGMLQLLQTPSSIRLLSIIGCNNVIRNRPTKGFS